MNFEWILLALFVASMINEIAKALTRPMHKNVLNLISIPVAFITTLLLQATGLFRSLSDKLVSLINLDMGTANEFISALITTLLGPAIFVLAYFVILLVIRIIHVNLIAKFIENRQIKKEKRLLKLAIKQERELVEDMVRDSEGRALDLIESLEEEGYEYDAMDDYDPMTKREIKRKVKARIKKEKRLRRKLGFFRESRQKKSISLIAGAVSGFLAFAIAMMPVFYTMSIVSDITNSIDKNDPQENKIYLAIDFVDEHVVEPYESSFVYEVYRSMALVDLMNNTVRLGGRMNIDGVDYYADDVVRDILTNSVKVATQLMSAKPNSEVLRNSLNGIITQPFILTLLTDAVSNLMANVEIPEGGESDDILTNIKNEILLHYKNADKEIIAGDIGALTDTIVTLVEKGLLMSLLTGDTDFAAVLADKDNIKDLLGTMSGLSVYDQVMHGAFTLGIDMIGPMLGIPADNAAAYASFMNKIVAAVDGVSAIPYADMEKLQTFFENAANYKKNEDQIAFLENRIAVLEAEKADPANTWTTEDETKLTELKTKLAEKKQESSSKASVLDYVIEPLRVVELLLAQGDELKAEAEELKTKGNDLQTKSEQLEANASSIEAEIAVIEQKVIDGEMSPTEAESEIARLEAEALNFENQAKDLASQAEDLIAQGEALSTKATDLVDQGKALAEDFEKRASGFTPFISYYMNWTTVHKPFMLAGEDTSLAPVTITIDGVTYLCNTDVLSIEMLLDMMLDAGNNGETTEPEENEGNGEVTVEETGEGNGEGNGEGTGGTTGETEFDINVDEMLEQIPFKELLEKLNITANVSVIESKASPISDLLNYILDKATVRKNAGATTSPNTDWVTTTLTAFVAKGDNSEESVALANKILAVNDENANEFDYKGVTVAAMHESLHFDEGWTAEIKKQDSEKLVDVIFTIIDLMGAMKGEGDGEQTEPEGEQASLTSNETGSESEEENTGNGEATGSDMTAMLDLLKTLGKTFDIMADTYCLKDLPPLMLEGLLKNEMLSMVMMPSMLNEYLEDMKNDDFSYEAFMDEFVGKIVGLLDKMNGNGGDAE